MSDKAETTTAPLTADQFRSDRELGFTRIIDAPPALLYRCWTEPELIKQWFTPRPWTTPVVETDVRAGGTTFIVMRGPDGSEHPNRGIYLDVVPNAQIVFTDAFTSAWQPSEKPFMVGIVTFEDAGDQKTKYTARVRHWSEDDCLSHEKMGFFSGWGAATDQLEALAKSLRS
jgi:uncharacterized protein YndB with AHSA1/START domain